MPFIQVYVDCMFLLLGDLGKKQQNHWLEQGNAVVSCCSYFCNFCDSGKSWACCDL